MLGQHELSLHMFLHEMFLLLPLCGGPVQHGLGAAQRVLCLTQPGARRLQLINRFLDTATQTPIKIVQSSVEQT